MTHFEHLPALTRLEAKLTAVPGLNRLILKFHQQRKKLQMARIRRQDAQNPKDLRNFERRFFSQCGEDGILEEIFRRIGEGSKVTVEFGIETGAECNSRDLIENHGWSALLFDGSREYVEAARQLYSGKPVRVEERFLEPDNIRQIFRKCGAPLEMDLLSIDVDGNDYWLCEELLKDYRPRAITIEYNGRWLPPVEWVMPYQPGFVWDGSVYFGASLQSLANLMQRSGYSLVCCSSTGLNAFFVRSDFVSEFPSANRGAAYHYAAPLYNTGFGHPVVVAPGHRSKMPA